MGDLTISYFKRLEKIKDTGKILPGHGGIFDRIDGLMFVVVLALVLYKFNVIT
jgi:phosphatidate cytidylyltransferase